MKLNLKSDQRKIRRYIANRVRDYPHYTNLGPGNDDDPISLITVGFYAEQGGYVSVVFDTRPNAGPDGGFDGNWTLWIDDDTMLAFPKWVDAYEAVGDGKPVTVTQYDESSLTLKDADGDEAVNAVFG